MNLYSSGLAHEDAANAASVSEFDAPSPQDGQDDEFGRWLEAQSALFRGKRPQAHGSPVPALLNRALLGT